MRIAIYIGLGIVALGLLLALLVAARSFRAERSDYVRHPRTELALHPERTGIAGLAEVSFPAEGHPRLAGWYAPSRNRAAIVMVHGTGTDRSSLIVEARILAGAGFGVLAMDVPGQGASEGRTRWGVPERRAISAAVDWLSTREDLDPGRIGGLGTSMGAYVMAQAAVLDPRLRSVVLVSSPSDVVEQNWLATDDWGLLTQIPCYLALRAYGQSLDMLPKDVLGRIAPRPVFIIAGDLDTLVPKFMAQQLYDAAASPKELWIVPGAHHDDFAQIAPKQYRTRLIEFFERTLLD